MNVKYKFLLIIITRDIIYFFVDRWDDKAIINAHT